MLKQETQQVMSKHPREATREEATQVRENHLLL
jgi:hypothetical protein